MVRRKGRGVHWCLVELNKAKEEGLFGQITFIMQSGRVVRMEKNTSVLPPDQEKVRADKF